MLTLRDDEPIPVAIQELWKLGQFERVELGAAVAGRDDGAAVGGVGRLDGSADGRRSLWQLTQGNILYLRHIVEQAVADGRLEERNGYWQWVGDPDVPHGLVEMIESRIGALPDAVATSSMRSPSVSRSSWRRCGGSPIRMPSKRPTSVA